MTGSGKKTATKIATKVGLAKPSKKSAPAPLSGAWIGVDRQDIPMTGTNADTTWFGRLADASNLRFSGAYLAGTQYPLNADGTASAAAQFTRPTKEIARGWVPNITTLRNQGWGIAFWYVGYSITPSQPLPKTLPAAQYAARGQLHARHAKTIIAAIAPALDGAVVYFDNEDRPEQNVTALKPYYGAFFDELQKTGPGALPALRPGLYAHGRVARAFLSDHPYLFVWDVKYASGNQYQPFGTGDNPLYVKTRRLDDIQIVDNVAIPNNTNSWSIWPLGKQFHNYACEMPIPNSPAAVGPPVLRAITSWDYNLALVRDPSFPVAEPRIACAPDGSVLVVGSFLRRTAGGAGDPPRMCVEIFDSTGSVQVAAGPSQYVEPDAPIVRATFPGSLENNFASILQTGDLAVFSNVSRIWQSTGSAATVLLRRIRAMGFVAASQADFQLFFVGCDYALYGSRRPSPFAPWSAPARMDSALLVHPSSNVAAAARAQTSVDVFAISDAGLLTTISWLATSTTWPASASLALEAAPGAFLPMTALAAVSATATTLHVFGVGTDLKLRYVEYTDANGWSPVKTLGGTTDFLSPHTRIAAHAFSTTRVEVAAVSDTGNVRVHALVYSGTAWAEESPRKELPPPEPVKPTGYPVPGGTAPTEVAFGWHINPFGDLGIAVVSGVTTVYAAGIAREATAVLCRTIVGGAEWIHDWQRYR